MALTLSSASIVDGNIARAAQVTQSLDAFTGTKAYDITISGSLTVTGSTALSGNLAIPGFPDVSASLALAGGSTDSFPFTGSAEITGSLTVTGSTNIDGTLGITGFPDVSASLAASGVGNGFPFTGSAIISGSLIVTGSTNILASEGSNLTLEVNESASFNFLTGGPNSGSFIVQTSPDTGNGELQVFTGQGTAVIASQNIPNHIFGIKYSSGSGASEGELSMAVGKRDLSNLGGANQNNFYVSYEPSGILTNAQGELEFFVGEHQNVGHGVLSVYRGGASGLTQTSSFAGYFSSSAFPGQQQYTRPFAISATSTVSDSNPAFVINKNVTDLTTSNFSVDYGGNVTASGEISASGDIFGFYLYAQGGAVYTVNTQSLRNVSNGLSVGSAPQFESVTLGRVGNPTIINGNITASGNISASGEMVANSLRVENRGPGVTADIIISGSSFDGDYRDAQIIYPNHGLHFNDDLSNNHVLALAGNNVGVRIQPDSETAALTVSGSVNVIDGNVTASGHGLFQAGKPIITHTSSPISSSLANAGKYHIVSGDLTASIVINSSTPVGAEYEFFQSSSAGQFLFESASGTTVISKNGSMRLAQQGSSAVLKKVSSTTFHLMGDLT